MRLEPGRGRLTAWAEPRARAIALLVIALVAGAPFVDGLVTGGVYTGCAGVVHRSIGVREFLPRAADISDACFQFEPWMAQALRALRSGEPPLWNPFQGLGAPLLGNMISALLWPLHAVHLLLPFDLALTAGKVARLAFAGIFTFLFLTRLGCRAAPATIGAIAFMWSSFSVVWLYLSLGNCAVVLPLLFWLIEETFVSRTNLALIGLTAALGLGWLGGHPSMYVHVLIAAGLYYAYKLWTVPDPRRRLRHAAQGGVAVLGGLGLAAVQLLPFAEYLAHSEAGRRLTLVENPFLRPFHLPLLWVPDLFGNYSIVYRYFDYGYFVKTRNYAEATGGYVGVTSLFLALVAVGWHWADRRVRVFAGLSAFSLAVAFGLPGVRAVFSSVPLLIQSHPNRGLLVHAFAVTVLAALALSDPALRRDTERPRRWWLALAGTVALLGMMSALGVWLAWPELKDPAEYLRYLKWLTPAMAANCLALGIVVALRRSWAFLLGVGLVVFVETAGHGWAMLHPLPRAEYAHRTPLIQYLEENLGLHRFAAFSGDRRLAPDLATYHGFGQLEHYDALLVGATVDALRRHMSGALPSGAKELRMAGEVDADFLRLLGVRFVIAQDWVDLEERVSARTPLGATFTPVYGERRLTVFRSLEEIPRAFVLPEAVEEVTGRSLVQLVDSPRMEAVIERYESTGVTVRLPPAGPAGTLVLSDAYYPGWHATVDRHPASVHQVRTANIRAVAVPAGARTVTFRYAPSSVRWGLLVSSVTCVALIGTAAGAWLPARRGGAPSRDE